MSAWERWWLLAEAVGLIAGWWSIRSIGLSRGRTALALLVITLAAVAGARAEFVIENAVPPAGWLDHRGMRAPGAFVAMAMVGPPALWALGIPVLRFLDALAPVAALCIFVGRFGCFIEGCCYGVPTALAWGVTYPFGTAPFANHLRRGLIGASATASLPVHPLALYLGVDALLIAVCLWWLSRRATFAGQVTLWLLVLRGWSKVSIELLREQELALTLNRSGTIEMWPALAASIVLIVVAATRRARV